MKTIYYYDTHIMSFDEEIVKEYLFNAQKSKKWVDEHIGVINDFDDLIEYCNDNAYLVEEIEGAFGIDLNDFF